MCESTETTVTSSTIHDDDEDVFATSLIDRYGARPVSLQNMCLATFAVTYDVIQSTTKKEDMDSDDDEEEEMQNTKKDSSMTTVKLQKGLGVTRKRNKKLYYIQEGTKFIQNQKNITMQSYFCIIHGTMKMTSYHHLQPIMNHTSISKI